MTDSFTIFARSLTSPAENARVIDPSDAEDLPRVTRALYVGGSGDITVRMAGGDVVTFANLQAGPLGPLRIARAIATGTLVGLW